MTLVLKNVCCMSLRTDTIYILYFFMITNIFEVIYSIRLFAVQGEKDSIRNAIVDWTTIFIRSIGIIVYLTAIRAISKSNTPSTSWLNLAIGFCLFQSLSCIHLMFLYSSDSDFFCEKLDTIAMCHADEPLHPAVLWLLIDKLILCYAVMVFYDYKSYLSETPTGIPAPGYVSDKEANFAGPSAPNSSQVIAPEYSVEPPQYSAQTPQYFVESNKK